MAIDIGRYADFLEQVASEIDIPPGKYQEAVSRYQSVGRWLEGGSYPDCTDEVCIYPQGSFRLGTVVRPVREGVESGYDIDLVCELPLRIDQTDPCTVKSVVGDRLRENETYRRLLDGEGRRCWTLEYAEQDGVGFHLDILPAVPARFRLGTEISITHKQDEAYSWSASDPRGYGRWFDQKNAAAFKAVAQASKQAILRSAPQVYASIDQVPDQLVRTPLQRAIQLMKRHRDLYFNNSQRIGYAPISIIITTLSAHLYGGELDVFSALSGIVHKLQGHAALAEGRAIDRSLEEMGLIQRVGDRWYISNPVSTKENFADRWHEDNHARARAFFDWVKALQADLLSILSETSPSKLRGHFGRVLGGAVVSKKFDLLALSAPADITQPHVHISDPARPWRRE